MEFYRDGITLEIDAKPKTYKTRDGHIVEEYSVDGKPGFFVTLQGLPFCAHGDTLAEAISDALWKDESKRPSLEELRDEIREAGKERPITLNEFRVLTGACLAGCKAALRQKKLDGSPMKAHDIHKHFPDWGGKLLDVLGWREEL
jgi:hypothetical protein